LYIKKLFSRYRNSGHIKEKIVLNHIITIHNCWGRLAEDMLYYKIPKEYHSYLKPFLVLLNISTERYNSIPLNKHIVGLLRQI